MRDENGDPTGILLDEAGIGLVERLAPEPSTVETLEPLTGIHAAVTRRRADGTPGLEG